MAASLGALIAEDRAMEIEALKAIYEDQFTEVDANLFEFRGSGGIILRMFLTEKYPDEVPVLEVSSYSSPGASDDLYNYLKEAAQSLVGSVMMHALIEKLNEWQSMNSTQHHNLGSEQTVCSFFLDGRCKFGDKCKNLHPQDSNNKSVASKSLATAAQEDQDSGESATAFQPPVCTSDSKKSRMKTASEVINRILWDEHIPSKHMIIGYLDRFVGVIEKPFADFSWEDLASVDNSVLAIPKHRIQYFKLCGEKVWDKNHRLDKVFGSTGDSETILEVLERMKLPPEEDSSTLPLDVAKEDESEGRPSQTDPRKKTGPNHFIAVRITDPQVLSAVEQFQNEVQQEENAFAGGMVPLSCLHVTLCTLKLDTEDQVALAGQILRSLQPYLWSLQSQSSPLVFKDVGSFYDRILYAGIEHHTGLEKFKDILKTRLQDAGLSLEGTHDDEIPHVTLMRYRGQLSLGNIVTKFRSKVFGSQLVQALHLCSMKDAKEEDGFHCCVKTVHSGLHAVSPSLPQKLSQHVEDLCNTGTLTADTKDDLISRLTSSNLESEKTALSELLDLAQGIEGRRGVVLIVRGVTGAGKSHLVHSSPEYKSNPGLFAVCDPKSLYQKSGICCLDPADRAVGESNCRVQFLEALSSSIPVVVVESIFARCWEYDFFRYVGQLFGYAVQVIDIACPNQDTLKEYYDRRNGTSLPWKQALMCWKSWEFDEDAVVVQHCSESNKSLLKTARVSNEVLNCHNTARQEVEEKSVTPGLDRSHVNMVKEEMSAQYDTILNDAPLPQRPQRARRRNQAKETPAKRNSLASSPPAGSPQGLGKGCDPQGEGKACDDEGEGGDEPVVIGVQNIVTGSNPIKYLFVFDFDMTLFLTPRNGEGQQEYRKLTGRMWPYTGWMAHPESMQAPFLIVPGPALEQYRTHYSRACSYTVILTGRPKSCECAVREVLFANDMFPHRLICQPNHVRGTKKRTVSQYKKDILCQLLAEFPDVVLVKLWDDRKDNLGVFQKVAEQHPNKKFEIFDVGLPPKVKARKEVGPQTKGKSKKVPIQKVKGVLKSQGLIKSELMRAYADVAQRYLRGIWQLTLRKLTSEDVQNCCFVMNTQSYLQGQNRLSVCLLAPRIVDLDDCVGIFREELCACGHKLCFLDSGAQYPTLHLGLEFDQLPRLNCQVHLTYSSEGEAKYSSSNKAKLQVESRRNDGILHKLHINDDLDNHDQDLKVHMVLQMVYLVFKVQHLDMFGKLTDTILRQWFDAFLHRHNKESATAPTNINIVSVDKLVRMFLCWMCQPGFVETQLNHLPPTFASLLKDRLQILRSHLEAEKGLSTKLLQLLMDCRHTQAESGVTVRINPDSQDDTVLWTVREYLSCRLGGYVERLLEHNVRTFHHFPRHFTEVSLRFPGSKDEVIIIEKVMKSLVIDLENLFVDRKVKIDLTLEK